MTDTKATDPLGNIPRYALYRNRKVRILSYDEGNFRILVGDDTSRTVKRSALIFLPETKKK